METTGPTNTTSIRINNNTYKRPVGAYVPPAKRVKSEKFDVGSEDYQRSLWDENKKKITGLINRANIPNVTVIIKELFKCNLIRYKGIFASALLKAQETSPVFTNVYAAILAVINSRIRTIGALVVNRLILQYRVSFMGNNKPKCLASVTFIAHLTNQEVVHEVLGFQLIDHLIDKPTPSSIEIVIAFIKECGAKLEQLNPAYLFETFKALRDLSLENDFNTRTHDLIDLIHVIRKEKFKNYPSIKSELDLVDENDKITHAIELNGPRKEDFHMEFNYFKLDSNWSENEAKYEEFKKSLLEENDDSTDDDEDGDDDDDEKISGGDSEESSQEEENGQNNKVDVKPDVKVIDATGSDVIAFRRMVYLTIRSSVRHEEVVHKLLKSKINPELHDELCQMILDCCGQERTYEKIYGLVASKLCQIDRRDFAPRFEKIFQLVYETIHRFETNKIRNIAKFYADLLTTESIDWLCLSCLKLRENVTSSAGRCFIKFLFQELVSILSLRTLQEYIQEPDKEGGFKDLFPVDQEQDIRFAINFWTFCGLGELTQKMREELHSRQ